jgi:hypothetical protein
LDKALKVVDNFIAANPEYSRHNIEQPKQGSTNRVIFATRGQDNVVFKICCDNERKERECFGLRYWQDTGLVAKLIWDNDPRMLVMSHVPGTWLPLLRKSEGEIAWRMATREYGRATAMLALTPLSLNAKAAFESKFYGKETVSDHLTKILRLGRAIHANDQDFRVQYWEQNLEFYESQIPLLLAQSSTLYHQDLQGHVRNGKFQGFFDVEMCRTGCIAMQLGSAMGGILAQDHSWQYFLAGWEDAIGRELTETDRTTAAAFNTALVWRVISRYFTYDGTPGSGATWATPADSSWARRQIDGANALLAV